MQTKILLRLLLIGCVISTSVGIYAAAEREENKELFFAAYDNDMQQVNKIINNQIFNLNKQRNIRGMTPLMVAAQTGAIDALNVLIGHGVNIEAKAWPMCEGDEYKKDQGKTALVYAAEKGHVTIVERLLYAGAHIESGSIESDDYVSALMGATFYEHIDVVKMLINASERAGIKDKIINAQNKAGYTALMIAAQFSRSEEIIQLLLNHGADKTVKSNEAKTALNIAEHKTADSASFIKVNQAVLDLLRA